MVNLKNVVDELKNNSKKFFENPGALMVSESKRIVEEFKSVTGKVTQCNKPDCTEKSCHETCYVLDKTQCMRMKNGICDICNHSHESHFNSNVYRRGKTELI